MDELIRPMSQFDVWMQIACLRVGFFVALGIPAVCCGVLGWLGGEYVGRRDANLKTALTDAEREAVQTAIGIVDWHKAYFSHLKHDEPLPSATLRKLLERTK